MMVFTAYLDYAMYIPIEEVVSKQNTTSTIPAVALLFVFLGPYTSYSNFSPYFEALLSVLLISFF
jgi:hypothetical protein